MIALALVLLSGAAPAAAPAENPYLAQARVLYQGLEYEKALQKLISARTWKGAGKAEQAEVLVYTGLCQYQLGDAPAARKSFKEATTLNPDARLPPLTSPKIVALFDEVAPKKVGKDKPAPVGLVEREEEAPKPASKAWIGYATLGASAAILLTGMILGSSAQSKAADAKKATYANETSDLNDSASSQARTANILFAVGGGTAALGIAFAVAF